MVVKAMRGPNGALDERSLAYVDSVFAGENLLQMVLHAHLLLERALDAKIGSKLARPAILKPKSPARFTFAQKVALFAGLFDPQKSTEILLLKFNRLRNAIAHEFVDLETEVPKHLALPYYRMMEASGVRLEGLEPRQLVVSVFGCLMLLQLGALHGVEWVGEMRSSVVAPANTGPTADG